jgi:subtilisin family serine protease
MKKIKLLSLVSGLIFCIGASTAVAQSESVIPDDWQLLSPVHDSIYGTAVKQVYQELLKDKTPHRVIVAVIDSGVDTAHADLRGHIWTNSGEIPGNGIDDDHNGYIDDVHGWNFLGGKNDSSIQKESSELDREYFRLHKKFSGVTDASQVKKKERSEYRYWLKIKEKREQDSVSNQQNYATVSQGIDRFTVLDKMLQTHIGKDTLYLDDIRDFETDNDTLAMAKQIASRVLENSGPHASLEEFLSEGKEYLSGLKQKLDGLDKDPNAARRAIVGDDPNDIKDVRYGNNDVTGHFARHATHVAGIIAAVRDNGIGINGITNDVLIMPVKVVPDGDERDKDVALGIRYAVDNGAQIINMSFGKGYSPHKKWVDDAVKYAEKHDVLLIHAAGNDGDNNDSIPNYPNPFFQRNGKRADNFITVGANGPNNEDGHLAASFSNYGKKEVDLFAPGVNIYSTVPGNKYESLSGTSMATPVVTGVAALILEYYPALSSRQLRWVLDHAVTTLDSTQVIRPGSNVKTPFSNLCMSGGIVNAYKAFKLAATIKGERKVKK